MKKYYQVEAVWFWLGAFSLFTHALKGWISIISWLISQFR